MWERKMIKKLRFLSIVQAKLGAFRTRRNKLKTAQSLPSMIQLPQVPCLHIVILYTTNNFMFLSDTAVLLTSKFLLFKMRRCTVSKVSESIQTNHIHITLKFSHSVTEYSSPQRLKFKRIGQQSCVK